MAHVNHVEFLARRHGDRVGSQPEDYCTYVTRLEKKTSMIDGPHFGNMQHAFKRVEVYEEVGEGFEAAGRFGRSKHMGQVKNKAEAGRDRDYGLHSAQKEFSDQSHIN